jgi:hypothetical protein
MALPLPIPSGKSRARHSALRLAPGRCRWGTSGRTHEVTAQKMPLKFLATQAGSYLVVTHISLGLTFYQVAMQLD